MSDEDDEYGINPITGNRVRRSWSGSGFGVDPETGEFVPLASTGDGVFGGLIASAFHASAVIVTDAAILLALAAIWLWHLARTATGPKYTLRACFAYLPNIGGRLAVQMGLPLLIGSAVMAGTHWLYTIPRFRTPWYGAFMPLGGTAVWVFCAFCTLYGGHDILHNLWHRALARSQQ
ncbi:MAG TPA: hypothetical protein VF292_02975 [Rhodanobacteraceae bacterium]